MFRQSSIEGICNLKVYITWKVVPSDSFHNKQVWRHLIKVKGKKKMIRGMRNDDNIVEYENY